MIGNDVLDEVLDKIKEIIDIEKFDDTKTLVETDDKLADDNIFENAVTWLHVLLKMVISLTHKYF